VERYYGQLLTIGSSVYAVHAVGTSILGVAVPFFGAPNPAIDALKTTIAYSFRLSKLECFLAASPLIYTFGFLFDTSVYRLGILYSDEKQDNSIQIDRQKQTYVFSSFYL